MGYKKNTIVRVFIGRDFDWSWSWLVAWLCLSPQQFVCARLKDSTTEGIVNADWDQIHKERWFYLQHSYSLEITLHLQNEYLQCVFFFLAYFFCTFVQIKTYLMYRGETSVSANTTFCFYSMFWELCIAVPGHKVNTCCTCLSHTRTHIFTPISCALSQTGGNIMTVENFKTQIYFN